MLSCLSYLSGTSSSSNYIHKTTCQQSQQPQAAASSASSVEGEASLPAAHSVHSGNSQMDHNVSLNQTDEMVLQQAHMSSRAQAIVLLPRSVSLTT